MKKGLTIYPELDNVLTEYSQQIQHVLGDNFVGMYLQGSLAIVDITFNSFDISKPIPSIFMSL